MSKTAHTPGPWKADLGEAFHVREQDGGRIATLIFMDGPFGFNGRRNPDEVAANARLIAAAPDLLEALEATTKALAVAVAAAGGDPETHHVSVKARAAIAKAKGGA